MAVLNSQQLFNKPFKLLARKLFDRGKLVETDRATDAGISLKAYQSSPPCLFYPPVKFTRPITARKISGRRASCFRLIASMQM